MWDFVGSVSDDSTGKKGHGDYTSFDAGYRSAMVSVKQAIAHFALKAEDLEKKIPIADFENDESF